MSDRPSAATILSRIGAGFFGLVFAITLPITLFAFAWGSVLFSAEQMTDIFADELMNTGELQELAIEAMLEQIPRGAADVDPGGVLNFLGRQRMNEILAGLFPPEWAESQLRANIESAYLWLDNDRLQPDFGLDIQPVKDRLLGGGAEQLANVVVDSWPTCGPEQVEVMISEGVPRGELPAFLCQPPEPLRSTVVSVATDLVLRQVSVLPEYVPLAEDLGSEATPAEIFEFKRGVRTLRAFARVGWLLPVSTLGLIVAVAVRSWPALLRWWGGPLLAAGVGTFFMLGIGEGMIERARNSEAMHSSFPPLFQSIIQDIVDRLLDTVSGQLFFLSFAIAAVGLVMLGVGIYLDRKAAATSISQRP